MAVIIFDLDGVLVSAKQIHYDALNKALGEINPEFMIGWNEHLSIYDGLKTHQKLALLTEKKGLLQSDHNRIWKRKQEITQSIISKLQVNERLVELCRQLKDDGHILACCSNSIRRSALTMLSKIGVIEFMDLILSNEDVKNAKPHPEMYWKAMATLNCLPEDVLIVEDSPPGLKAASNSGATVLRVANPEEVTYEKLQTKIRTLNKSIIPKWQGGKMNIVIPMAGAGSRFQQSGYVFPKPLIDVDGLPMIQRVVNNININSRYIFIVQKEHREKYNLDMMFKLFVDNFLVVETEGVTEGAACTVLLAKEYINSDESLLMANSDQIIDWNSNDFMYKMQEHKPDGCILTFTSTHPMYSFAKTNEDGQVIEVAEKKPISNKATVGFYYWNKGSDFVKYAEQMINKNIRVNNEFYVCPVYNEAIQDNKLITTYHIDNIWPLGTPDQLNHYINLMQGAWSRK